MLKDYLWQRSICIIIENQHASGAYPASPNFPPYRYSWFRDGSFIAHAMDLVGRSESAARFHTWAAQAIVRRAALVLRAVEKMQKGNALAEGDILHTRYTAAGDESVEEWANFQLDGFGTWLWSLVEHSRISGQAPSDEWLHAARLIGDYLNATWQLPCSDCWEEFADQVHPHTLAAIYAGLKAEMSLTGSDRWETIAAVRAMILERGVMNGVFSKYLGSSVVDASLLGLCVPYGVVDVDHPLMLATVREIEGSLMAGGGVHRYLADSYYGGGAWLLLTAWLGWYKALAGEEEQARAILGWVEAHAGENGEMPEQIPVALNDPAYYPIWQQRWGEIAKPLLWSHAMYIILHSALDL